MKDHEHGPHGRPQQPAAEIAITIRFEHEFYAVMGRIADAGAATVNLLEGMNMKLDEALDAIGQVGDEQAAAKDVLLQEVGKVGAAVDGLEQQLRDAVSGELSPEAQAKFDAAMTKFRGNTQGMTDAAATVKAGTDDATDGTST